MARGDSFWSFTTRAGDLASPGRGEPGRLAPTLRGRQFHHQPYIFFFLKKLNQDFLDFFLGLGQVGSDVNQRAHWLLLTTFSFSYNYAQLSHKPVILLKTFFYDKSPFFNIWGRRQLRLLQGKYWFSTSRTYLETKIDKKSSHVFSLGPKRLPGIFFNPPIYSIT